VQALIERRCKIIVVVDASQDDALRFDDLAILMGRMKVRDGVTLHEIESGQELCLGDHAEEIRGGQRHHFCAEIRYQRTSQPSNGLLVYFKNSLSGDEPPFVWNHAANNADFPHDSTLNQSFRPDQFWAYLGLGQHYISSLVEVQRAEVDEVAASKSFDLRRFARLFLHEVEEDIREDFLHETFVEDNPGTTSARKVNEAIYELRESTKTRAWHKLDGLFHEVHEKWTNSPEIPEALRSRLLDALVDALISMGDELADALRDLRSQVAGLIVTVALGPRDDRNGTLDQKAVDRIAFELRRRFQRPETTKYVRPVLEVADVYNKPDVWESLLDHSDVSTYALSVELICRIGDRLAVDNDAHSEAFRRIVMRCTFHRSKQVRHCAKAIVAALQNGESAVNGKQASKRPRRKKSTK
jgi:hypothetical protein